MATYYIATNGDDGNSGTIGSPKAHTWVNSLVAGDIAIFRGGVYHTQLSIRNLIGTVGSHITIRNEAGETPVIDGGWDGSTWPNSQSGSNYTNLYLFNSLFYVKDCVYLDISGFHVVNSSGEGLECFRSENIEINDMVIDNIFMSGVIIQGDNSTPGTYYSDVNLTDITVTDTVKMRPWKNITNPDGGVLTDHPVNVFYVNYMEQSTGLRINTLKSGGEGIAIGRNTRYITYEDCTTGDNQSVGGYFQSARNATFDRCTFWSSDARNAQIGRKNSFTIADEDGSLNPPFNALPSQDLLLRNCLMINGKRGIAVWAQATQKNIAIENCTIINAEYPLTVQNPTGTRLSPPDGNTLRNNLFYNTTSVTVNGFSPSAGWTKGGNLFYNSNVPSQLFGSLTSDPVLLSPDAPYAGTPDPENFRQITGSPTINAGTANGVVLDRTSLSRVGVIDIGALEFGTVTPDPSPCLETIITNGDFSDGATDWSAVSDGAGAVVSGEYHISGTVATSPFNQLYQSGISVTNTQIVYVRFTARNDDAGNPNITVAVLQHGTPFANLGLSQVFVTTGSNAEYSTSFTVNATEADARLQFHFVTGDFYIDNICVRVLGTGRAKIRMLQQAIGFGTKLGF